jgi:SAM-dependent methyltransferase
MNLPEGSFYVDAEQRVLQGEEAAAALRANSDARYLTGDGVAQVPIERWQEAQRYEERGWRVAWAGADDDRNHDHQDLFDGYRALRALRFAHAIELGCGAFTNLRIIAAHASVARCSLLDPLIESYLTLPNCRYTRAALAVDRYPVLARARRGAAGALGRLLARAAPGALSRPLPVHELLPVPIERLDTAGRRYDLVVMINVLEHCFDARRVLGVIGEILAPGGALVYADRSFHPAALGGLVANLYDAGHPLRVAGPVIDEFLDAGFEPRYRRRVPGTAADEVYFIGIRR